MIKNNSFYFDELETVVFIGYTPIFESLVKINKDNKIKSIIVTSSDQAKYIDENIKFNIFDDTNEKFKSFVKKNTNPKKTLFFSIGARNIFKKEIIEELFQNNLVNTHGTRLPLGRGEPMSWRVLKEDRLDNQLIHLVKDKIDFGPIIFNKLTVIPKEFQFAAEIQQFSHTNFIIFTYPSYLTSKKQKIFGGTSARILLIPSKAIN